MSERFIERNSEIEAKGSVSPIRTLTTGDIGSLRKVSDTVGWSFSPDRIATFLNAGNFWGHCVNGKPVSSAGVFPYGQELSGIGIVMVKPAYQQRGFGRSLMDTCLEKMGSCSAVLIATEMGAPLYKKLGFRTINMVQRWTLSNDVADGGLLHEGMAETAGVTGVASSDEQQGDYSNRSEYRFGHLSLHHIPSLIELDNQFTGVYRDRVFNAIVYDTDKEYSEGETDSCYRRKFKAGLSGVVALRRCTQSMEGFALVMENDRQIQIGPVMAQSDDLAIQLLRYALRHFKDSRMDLYRPFRMDVPDCHTSFTKDLAKDGWELQRTSPMMLYGSWDASRYKQHTFGLIDPAFG